MGSIIYAYKIYILSHLMFLALKSILSDGNLGSSAYFVY